MTKILGSEKIIKLAFIHIYIAISEKIEYTKF